MTFKLQLHPRFYLLCIILFPLLAWTTVSAQTDLPTLDDLEAGWNSFSPSGESVCARGTPFHFFVRPAPDGNTDKLMVYFQGGGACWNGFTCRIGGTFDDTVSENPQDELGQYNGIFDFENSANPVADYNIVFIPYCTADVHVGDATVEYMNGLSIQHNGVKNTFAVLDWVFANFDAPSEIIVTGSSAGAYGAIYHAPLLIEQYPEARTLQFGDAGVGATPVGWEVLQTWGMFNNLPMAVPQMAEVDPDTFTLNVLYDSFAEYYPDALFSQYTTAADEVQIYFYDFSALDVPEDEKQTWDAIMTANLESLNGAHANFRSMIVGGTSHTILALPEFYNFSVDGVRVRDWFAALAAGEPLDSLACAECADAEVTPD
jgi:hypothetical protein